MKINPDTHGCARWFNPLAAVCIGLLAGAQLRTVRASMADTGCFGKQLDSFIPDPVLRKRVSTSLVFLVALRDDGSFVTSGTGFVAKGSAQLGEMARIITASHVAAMSTEPGVASLSAFSPTGNYLGTVVTVARGDRVVKPDLDTYEGFRDVAVLSIIPADAEAEAAYRAIDGLDIHLSSSTPKPIFAVMGADKSTGVGQGDSGAPLLNAQGTVFGILSKVADIPGRLVSFPAPSMASWINGGSGTRMVKSPQTNAGAFVQVGGAGVVEALGMTGIPSSSADLSSVTPVMVAGFRSGGCTVSFGNIGKISSR